MELYQLLYYLTAVLWSIYAAIQEHKCGTVGTELIIYFLINLTLCPLMIAAAIRSEKHIN